MIWEGKWKESHGQSCHLVLQKLSASRLPSRPKASALTSFHFELQPAPPRFWNHVHPCFAGSKQTWIFLSRSYLTSRLKFNTWSTHNTHKFPVSFPVLLRREVSNWNLQMREKFLQQLGQVRLLVGSDVSQQRQQSVVHQLQAMPGVAAHGVMPRGVPLQDVCESIWNGRRSAPFKGEPSTKWPCLFLAHQKASFYNRLHHVTSKIWYAVYNLWLWYIISALISKSSIF